MVAGVANKGQENAWHQKTIYGQILIQKLFTGIYKSRLRIVIVSGLV